MKDYLIKLVWSTKGKENKGYITIRFTNYIFTIKFKFCN